jgi:hypothetical protein
MADHRVVCTDQIPSNYHPKGRIVAVGIGTDSGKASQQMSVAEVVSAIDRGHRFYTVGDTSGRTAWVEKYWCSPCGGWHIKTRADAVWDNNLDSLRACRWSS